MLARYQYLVMLVMIMGVIILVVQAINNLFTALFVPDGLGAIRFVSGIFLAPLVGYVVYYLYQVAIKSEQLSSGEKYPYIWLPVSLILSGLVVFLTTVMFEIGFMQSAILHTTAVFIVSQAAALAFYGYTLLANKK